jgi:uncharacterized protein
MKYKFKGKEYEVKNVLNRSQQEFKIDLLKKRVHKGLVIEDSGMTVYTKAKKKELSEGCRACKTGTWWCLFVGNNCNNACKFCPQPKTKDFVLENPRKLSKYWINDVKFYLDRFGDKLTGISYSGGEPFLYLEKIKEVAEYVNRNRPGIYQWIYTNGKLITKDNLEKIKDWGIEEIRVDLAATGFDSEIIGKLEECKKIIGKVIIEVPSIPEVAEKLIDEKYLKIIEEKGVEQLNLAEMELKEAINFETYAKGEEIYIYDDIDGFTVCPSYSRQITYKIIDYSIKEKVNILINDCSADTKHLQRVMRNSNLPRYLF